MLQTLRLINFRGFEDHTVPFRKVTVLVGRNNAGKSTIAEALRLVSIVVTRSKYLPYKPVPNWLQIPIRNRGITPSLDNVDFDFDNVCYRYGEPPAEIVATFVNGIKIRVFLNPTEKALFAVILKKNGDPIISKSLAGDLDLTGVNILPQITPLHRHEKKLVPDYVRRAFNSNLASLHFRNQIHLLYDDCFKSFKDLAESTWPGLQIKSLEGHDSDAEDLSLLIRDGSFVAEAGWMGHGLQIWLQTMWFLARVSANETVILDEPDVYLHADLQRNLFRLVRQRYNQIIVATHSIEILSEADADEILIVDKGRKRSSFATSLPAVQQVIDTIGGLHNLQLARLWSARRCLLVEGDDIPVLKAFQDKLFPESKHPIDTVPAMELGGWGGWKLAMGSSMLLKNAGDERIKAYCIIDSDYHTEDEINEIKKEAKTHKLQLHVWKRKEIENYLIVPSTIQRAIQARLPAGKPQPGVNEIVTKIDELCEKKKDDVTDSVATEIQARNRAAGLKPANTAARAVVASAWSSFQGRISIVPGKDMISGLSGWSKRRFGVSLNRLLLARSMWKSEVDGEVQKIIDAVEHTRDF